MGSAPAAPPVQPLERIALGSFNRADRPQPLWTPIFAAQPGLGIWAGDIIYADTPTMRARKPNQATWRCAGRSPPWESGTTTTAVNDAGAEYPQKTRAAKLLLNFLDGPEDSPRRQQEGLYTGRWFGPAGRMVRVLLLDTR